MIIRMLAAGRMNSPLNKAMKNKQISKNHNAILMPTIMQKNESWILLKMNDLGIFANGLCLIE